MTPLPAFILKRKVHECRSLILRIIVSISTGTIYQADEPILFQSIRNPFVFRCIDGILIDGNDKGLSKLVFQ